MNNGKKRMAQSEQEVTVVKIPEGDIVVTRKVPMTEKTCDELRAIRKQREDVLTIEHGQPVTIPYPTLIKQLVEEEAERITIH